MRTHTNLQKASVCDTKITTTELGKLLACRPSL